MRRRRDRLLHVLPRIGWLRRRQLELRVKHCKTQLLPDGLPSLLHRISLILRVDFLRLGLRLVLLSRSAVHLCLISFLFKFLLLILI